MIRICKVIGRLPHPLGDMPGVSHEGALLMFGGASGMDNRDEILKVETSGSISEVGRLPRPCRGHQAVKVGQHVYILGGFAEGTLNDAYRLDLRNFKAEPVAPMPRDAAWFTAVLAGGRIFVVGGFSIPDGYWAEIAVYDPAKDEWSLKKSFPDHVFPKAVLGSNAAVAVGDRILSVGGADTFDAASMRANSLGICALFDPKTEQWQRLPASVEPREGLVPVSYGERAFLIGGMLNPPAHASDLIDVVETDSLSTTPFARLNEGRAAAACGVVDGQLLVAGGVTEGIASMTDSIESVAVG
jgi:hypothetical protein